MSRHLRSSGAWGLLFLLGLGACRGRAAPAPEPSTTGTPRTDTPAASASQAASASATSSSSSGPQAAEAGAQVEPADAGPAAAPKVIARGARVIVVDRERVVAQRPKGQATPLELARAPRDKDTKLSATIGPFLGRTGLLDVAVVESAEHGWHYERSETHYVLDTSGASDVLACVFAGDTSSGGEYASTSTSIAVKETTRKPVSFDVIRTTTSRASQPQGRPPSPADTKEVEHFELGGSSCAPASRQP